MTAASRLQTGIPDLDDLLGGGLIPGTMTVVMGATGIGKTQLGLQFARTGLEQEGETGILFDMTSRGDSQNHRNYARRMFNWNLRERLVDGKVSPGEVWNRNLARADYIHLFRRSGRRVTMSDLEPDERREWKIELSRKLDHAIAFLYGNFVHGAGRCVMDGIEPAEQAADSFQFRMFEYVYHQILHKESEWVARDLFRADYRNNAQSAAEHAYDHSRIGCLLLYTCHEVMLDDLLGRQLDSGDLLSNASTIILMGKTRNGSRMGRALHVAKHRGSVCDESIVPFEITDRGLHLMPEDLPDDRSS